LSNIPLKTTADSVWVVEHLTHKQKVVDLNPAAGIFFLKNHTVEYTFLLPTFETAVTWHPNHLWRWNWSKIKRPSSGNSNIVVVYRYLLLSVIYSMLKALV